MPDKEASDGPPPRILPDITDHNRPFWTSGSRGQLTILWCEDCGSWIHPPSPSCAKGHTALEPRIVSGQGTVFSFTVNRHPFHPSVPPPYVVAIIELDEQKSLRMIANIVGCSPEDVTIGMRVQVDFEQQGELFVPVFTPAFTQTDQGSATRDDVESA